MSLDRKYVISAAIAAFVAWALLTDWIPSLRWAPHAFLLGSLATFTGLILVIVSTSKGTKEQDDSLRRYGPVAPAFSTNKSSWGEKKAVLKGREEYRRPTIFPDAPRFSKAVDGLLDSILRDFVTSWYGHISERPLFQNEIDRCIRSVLLSITSRLTELDLVKLSVSQILPIVTDHLKDFYDAERSVRGKDLQNNVTESEELSAAIASKYRNGRLHAVASLAHSNTTASSQDHLRLLVERILTLVLPSNMKTSQAVNVLVREILACAVLAPALALLADPDFWNQMIVSIGGPMLQDRKSVRKVRAALDEHASISPKASKNAQLPRLRPYDNERQFEKFVRAIRHVSTLPEARRFRSEVATQLRRDSSVAGQDVAHLRRLETGKRLLDQRIAHLSVDGVPKLNLSARAKHVDGASSARKRQAPLREVVYDAAGLGYFMEFMDRQNLMRLVQFFLVVDGFRNPLENDTDEPPHSVAYDPDRMDIGQMYNEYLSKPELRTPEDTVQLVKQYLKAGPNSSPQDYIQARRAVLQSQTRIYNYMKETSYEAFKRSDLYFKWLAIDDDSSFSTLQDKQTDSLDSEMQSERDQLPVPLRKKALGVTQREPELRRAVLSTNDLKGSASSGSLFGESSRRSVDDNHVRPALFDDNVDDEKIGQSVSSLRSNESDGETAIEAQERARAVSDMQIVLDKIVGDSQDKDSLFSEPIERKSLEEAEPLNPSAVSLRPTPPGLLSSSGKPSIASLGLVGAPSSRGVFVDDLFGDETEKFAEDEREDTDTAGQTDDDRVKEAAPGDLGLSEAIDGLNADIERLNAQRTVLDSLTAKAELTNNTAELRILRKSEQSLQREIKRKEMQKQQYVVQESDNSLYGRAAISIKSVMVGREEDGHEFALYVIEVRRQAGDQMSAATWAITRRYSQFHELHKRLKARFPAVRQLDFPRRQALFTLQKDFIQKRRITLERYLRSLLLVPAICQSRELRAFLSQSAIASDGQIDTQVDTKDFVTRIYNSVSDGMEEFLGNIPVLDQLSVAGQNLISAATAQISGGASIDSLDPATQDPATATEAEAELNAYETKEAEPFVKPICDLFLEAFELSKGNSWLRGRTVVVVLHQLLGGTIERKVREGARNALQDDSMARYVEILKDLMWPNGKLRPPSTPRNALEKARTRKEAGALLGTLVPDIAGSVVGRNNGQAASRKIVTALNNPRLNTHLVYMLVDEFVRIVFPEIPTSK